MISCLATDNVSERFLPVIKNIPCSGDPAQVPDGRAGVVLRQGHQQEVRRQGLRRPLAARQRVSFLECISENHGFESRSFNSYLIGNFVANAGIRTDDIPFAISNLVLILPSLIDPNPMNC